MSEEQINKLISDVCNAAAFFTMEYNKAQREGGYLDYGLDSHITPIVRAALAGAEKGRQK